MLVAIEVIIKLFEKVLKPHNVFVELNKIIRDIKLALTYNDDIDYSLFTEVFQNLKIKCDCCSKKIQLNNELLHEFINEYLYTCPHCGYVSRVGEYFYNKEDN